MSSSTTEPPLPPSGIKRLITGHDSKGDSTILFDDEINAQPANPAKTIYLGTLWATEETPAKNSDQTTDMNDHKIPERLGLVQTGGSHCITCNLAPGGKVRFHRTHSVDYDILISGSLTLVLTDGTERTISEPGSIIVQRGTSHAWENRGTEWAKYIVVLIDAEPVEIDTEASAKTVLSEGFFQPQSDATKL